MSSFQGYPYSTVIISSTFNPFCFLLSTVSRPWNLRACSWALASSEFICASFLLASFVLLSNCLMALDDVILLWRMSCCSRWFVLSSSLVDSSFWWRESSVRKRAFSNSTFRNTCLAAIIYKNYYIIEDNYHRPNNYTKYNNIMKGYIILEVPLFQMLLQALYKVPASRLKRGA